jgi:hypothetical protein
MAQFLNRLKEEECKQIIEEEESEFSEDSY